MPDLERLWLPALLLLGGGELVEVVVLGPGRCLCGLGERRDVMSGRVCGGGVWRKGSLGEREGTWRRGCDGRMAGIRCVGCGLTCPSLRESAASESQVWYGVVVVVVISLLAGDMTGENLRLVRGRHWSWGIRLDLFQSSGIHPMYRCCCPNSYVVGTCSVDVGGEYDQQIRNNTTVGQNNAKGNSVSNGRPCALTHLWRSPSTRKS